MKLNRTVNVTLRKINKLKASSLFWNSKALQHSVDSMDVRNEIKVLKISEETQPRQHTYKTIHKNQLWIFDTFAAAVMLHKTMEQGNHVHTCMK